ncbi:MAG: type II toxin-antitoxin system HicA family toxin [Patescibacteria group bacterium]
MPKIFSGKKVVKILCKDFGFYFVSQKGSHVKLEKKFEGKTIITIVPMHKELAFGTFKGVLDLAQIDEKSFLSKAK